MEHNYIEINYDNKKEKVLQFIMESDSQFKKRLDYIKKAENKKLTFKDATRFSKLWFTITYKNCKYESKLYNQVMKVIK